MSNGMVNLEEFLLSDFEDEKPKKRRPQQSVSPMVREVQVRVLMRLREISREEAVALVHRKRK